MINKEIELPTSWESCKLGDIINYGSTSKAEPLQMQPESWLLELEDIEKDTSRLVTRLTVSSRKPKSTKNKFKQGQVLYGKLRPYLNKIIIADKDGYCSTEIVPLPQCSQLDERYLFYWLKSPTFLDYTDQVSHGINMPRLGTKAGNEAPFIIAPLAEQRRIADKLDTTLAAVEACKEKLQSATETIQRFRQSVLAAAVSGELTREWREERGIEGEWEEKQLQALLDEPMRNGKSVRDGNQTKVLRLSCLSHDLVNTSDNKSGDWTGINPEPFLIKEGDFLIARGNGSINLVGRGRLVPETKEEIAFPDTMIRIRPDKNKIRPDYLALLWESAPIRKQLELGARTSAGIWKISQGDLNCIKFKIPTLAEQDLICLRAREHLSAAQNSKDKIQDTSKILELLSKALLAKAFRGELVPQDPSDEPASLLLERIKAQRAAEAAIKKPAKRGRKTKADAAQLVIPDGIADNHLAKVLEECGALSERALLAASELEPGVFQLQLSKELQARGLKQVDVDGEAAYADAAWEEEG